MGYPDKCGTRVAAKPYGAGGGQLARAVNVADISLTLNIVMRSHRAGCGIG